jgi:hypothetical protein
MAKILDLFKRREVSTERKRIEMPLTDKEKLNLLAVASDKKKIAHMHFLLAISEAVTVLSASQIAALVGMAVLTALTILPKSEREAFKQLLIKHLERY